MNPFEYLKTLEHHAYFVHSFNDSFLHLKNFLKNKLNIEQSKNPDFYHRKFETFSIDDSRRIKELHSSRSFTEDGKRIFIIETDSITHEAQNSLLKIFEEPNENSHFFIIMSSVEILLPTLRSRLYVLTRVNKENIDSLEIEKFLELSKKEKIDFVDKLAKDINDEKLPKSEAQNFLRNLEAILYKKGVRKNSEVLKIILKAEDYMSDRSSSIKQLLEFVVLML